MVFKIGVQFKINQSELKAILDPIKQIKRNVEPAGKRAGINMARRMKKNISDEIKLLPRYNAPNHNTPISMYKNATRFVRFKKSTGQGYMVFLSNEKLDGLRATWVAKGHKIKYRVKYGKDKGKIIDTGKSTRPVPFFDRGVASFIRNKEMDKVIKDLEEKLTKKGLVSKIKTFGSG